MSENASNDEPMKSAVWDRKLADHPNQRCKAHRKNGEQCRKWAIAGSTVCRTHGGAAKQVRNAARVRLANAADRLARELLKMATDDKVSDSVKLAAIRDALDRGGVSVKAEVELTAKPYEDIFESIQLTMHLGGSRAEHRRSMGIPDATPALVAPTHDDHIEAEIVDDFDDADMGDLYGASQPITPDDDERASVFDTAPARDGLMTMEDGMSEIARLRREAAQRTRQEQRALPPGNSARR
ncbi:hypothetical protein MSIMFI_03771 [Mycobacterium simulans]|uniref:hypothetical protein n=1 Tax=Mycobacterium simulans TaxID=627089 RepID=UPI0017493A0D|nr:hypothetical protein [Mycobacterium simulans]SON62250.1 hypothetical protein MSIMFI_03771 [Mycobacterium simulans]